MPDSGDLNALGGAVRDDVARADSTGSGASDDDQPPRYVRIAYCSVAEEAIPELVKRIEAGVTADVSSQGSIASR